LATPAVTDLDHDLDENLIINILAVYGSSFDIVIIAIAT